MFDNISEFKRDFTHLQNYFDIKPVLTTIKNPQDNAPTELAYQEIFPWGGTLASIAWTIRASYCCTFEDTPGQVFFGMYMIFNLVSVVDCQVTAAGKQRQVDIDNVQENARQVIRDYAIIDLVYVKITGIYLKLFYNKQGP